MSDTCTTSLKSKSCQPCEGGVSPLSKEEAQAYLDELDQWTIAEGNKAIRRQWEVRDFEAGISFLRQVADIAEQEDHHPDVHLTGYRNVTIELTTHAIDGLSENDFIVAAKIDDAPVALKGD